VRGDTTDRKTQVGQEPDPVDAALEQRSATGESGIGSPAGRW
jgi:hypothetical protein